MSDGRDLSAPLFSVVIPLEYHRDKWETCLHAWQVQSIAASEYELLLVIPPGFSERSRLAALTADMDNACRVVTSDLAHDVNLCAVGADHAVGQNLFFTESHCWPESDVLALCVQALDEHPDWAGFSCQSVPVISNRLGRAEAAMYAADIHESMAAHPWRKILDQCFVTRRDAYSKCGGFKPEFGHFAEWALAANYHALGLTLGYLPEAKFSHQYIGKLNELRTFTLDFVRGETRYLFDATQEPGAHLIELSDEWMTHGNFDRTLARALSKDALRWLTPAIFGDRLHRATASLSVIARYVRVAVAIRIGSRRKLSASFKSYVAALIHRQRLSSIAAARSMTGPSERAGFYRLETFGETQFRWSEPAAIVRIELPAGASTIAIECLPVVTLPTIAELRFRLDGTEVPDADIVLEPHRIVINADAENACTSTLSWICSEVNAPNDPRRLGLPIVSVDLAPTTKRG